MANKAKAKGTRAEVELVEILTEIGVPSMRVLGSGAFKGADSDLKVGVRLKKDGSMPAADEGDPLLRAEVKNRKDNPEYIYKYLKNEAFAMINSPRSAPEFIYEHLNQDEISKCVIMKRAKTPSGALKNKDFNQTHLVVMGLGDFISILKELYEAHK